MTIEAVEDYIENNGAEFRCRVECRSNFLQEGRLLLGDGTGYIEASGELPKNFMERAATDWVVILGTVGVNGIMYLDDFSRCHPVFDGNETHSLANHGTG
jgi:hypothetical protein